ncbi:hypothetical protein C0993_008702, partial [Termitomyces sp. T159_Od127]
LCIETPRTGSRLLQSSDDQLLSLAANLRIPVIIVFTKFDLLYNEHHRKASKRLGHNNTDMISSEAEQNARIHLQGLINTLKSRPEIDNIERIHLDMIKVWNFYDPEKLLPGEWFCTEMIKLIEPLLDKPGPGPDVGGALADLGNFTTIAGTVGGPIAPLLSAAGIAIVVVNFLCQKYQAIGPQISSETT